MTIVSFEMRFLAQNGPMAFHKQRHIPEEILLPTLKNKEPEIKKLFANSNTLNSQTASLLSLLAFEQAVIFIVRI